MNKTTSHFSKAVAFLVLAAVVGLAGCTGNNGNSSMSNAEVDSLRSQIKQLTAGNDMIAKHLAIFDTLDYTVFSNQEWTRLHESHAQNVKVNWPDGHFTTGIERHIADLKALFVY